MPDASPWPETRRSQLLVAALGAAFLLPGVLSVVDLVEFGDTAIVGGTAVASALLIYALLGWAGTWVAADRPGAPDGADGEADRGAVAGPGEPDGPGPGHG